MADDAERIHDDEIVEANPGAPVILSAPLRLVAIGASGSGKTSALLKDVVLPKLSPFGLVIWCGPAHSLRQPKLQRAKEILDERAAERGLDAGLVFVDCTTGIDSARVDELVDLAFDNDMASLVVFDDLMYQRKNQSFISNLYTNGRHRRASVCELRQRAFSDGREARDNRVNANAFILCTAQADEINMLLRQICDTRAEAARAFGFWQDATENDKHGYLIIDKEAPLKPKTGPSYRYRKSGLTELYV